MDQPTKKPIKLGALAMVILSLSILFSILAYGYGSANQATKDTAWCYNNIETIATNAGFTIIKTISQESSLDINTICLNSNLSNNSICSVTI
jgi:hypothetical protein